MGSRKSIRAQRRKKVRAEALAAMALLTREQLINLRHEVGREMALQSKVVNELRVRLEAIRMELERRDTSTPVGIHISDHAVLRYLERRKGVNMSEVRAEIADMAVRAGSVRLGKNGRRYDPATGLTMGVDEETASVTTVFADEELPVMEVID